MLKVLTAILILGAAGVACAQDEGEKRLSLLREEHDRRVRELESRFREERARLEEEFQKRLSELGPQGPRPEGDRSRPPAPLAERGGAGGDDRRPERRGGEALPEPGRGSRPGSLEEEVHRLSAMVARLLGEVERLKSGERRAEPGGRAAPGPERRRPAPSDPEAPRPRDPGERPGRGEPPPPPPPGERPTDRGGF